MGRCDVIDLEVERAGLARRDVIIGKCFYPRQQPSTTLRPPRSVIGEPPESQVPLTIEQYIEK